MHYILSRYTHELKQKNTAVLRVLLFWINLMHPLSRKRSIYLSVITYLVTVCAWLEAILVAYVVSYIYLAHWDSPALFDKSKTSSELLTKICAACRELRPTCLLLGTAPRHGLWISAIRGLSSSLYYQGGRAILVDIGFGYTGPRNFVAWFSLCIY